VKLPVLPPLPPMEARTAAKLPLGEEWQYEPKWDGFRCLVFRDGADVRLQSKASKPLGRYFPDVVAAVRALPQRRFVLDGEIVVPVGGGLSFDELLQRIHPAESRVRRLAAAHPALLVAFDLLATGARSLLELPLAERRRRLEAFAAKHAPGGPVRLSPATLDAAAARRWLEGRHGGLDGVMAKRLAEPYRPGERAAMVKVKRLRTADCVVGGFRYAARGGAVGSLLLGLYDDAGLLHHVGFTSSLTAAKRRELTARLEALRGGAGFTGRAPGGPSRWSTARSAQWEPVEPTLVVEVAYDHVTGGRFRHGTRFLRLRPDKAPRQCTFEQLQVEGAGALGWL
jgi:ATP-dependent DNA ligase